jgi:hypothetical protein
MAVSGVIAVVGAGASALSSYNKANTEKKNLNYQAQVEANNAIIAQDQATVTELDGQQQVFQHDLQTSALYGTERANLAASGVDLGQGSANDILASTKLISKIDANTIQDNALRAAWGFKVQRDNATENASHLRENSNAISPGNAAFSSLLGSAVQANSSWNSYASSTGGTTSGQWMKSLFA